MAIAAIGLPLFSHENNAMRALKLSVRIFESGIAASIGVTTAETFCGSVGSELRSEYAVVGDSVNLDASFMGFDQLGEIKCDEQTKIQSEAFFDFLEVEQIKVKGQKNPVRCHTVKCARIDHNTIQTETYLLGVDPIVANVQSIGAFASPKGNP